MRRTRPRSTCTRRASTVALVADVRDTATGAAAEAAREAGIESRRRARRSWGRRVGWACAASRLAALSMERSWTAARSPAMRCSCPAATRRACICSRSRAASSRGTQGRQAFLPDRARRARALGRGLPRRRRPRVACSTTAAQAGARRSPRCGSRRGVAATYAAVPRVTSTRWARRARCGRARDRRRHVRSSTSRTTSRAKDLALAAREGFVSIEHIKRYTTAGMATDQGKTSNMNALAIVADDLARPLPNVGLTTFRMPYTPVTFGIFAGYDRGDLFDPVRTTPMHEWASRHGAVFEDVGQWKRARYFPRDGERHARGRRARVSSRCARRAACSMRRHSARSRSWVRTPRRSCRECMSTTLRASRSGRCRYGILLRDDGFICDDGVIARVGDDRFHVTTTTGGAARVLRAHGGLPADRVARPPRVAHVDHGTVGGHRRAGTQGPRRAGARSLRDVDISAAALPHLAVTDGRDLRRPDAAVPRELHGRARVRGQRAGRLRAFGLGGGLLGGARIRHHALWNRDDARPARREGLHHRGSGNGRHRHALRCGARLGDRQEQGRLRRQALARATRHAGGGPQATRGSRDGRSGHRPRRGRAGRRADLRRHRRCD